MSYPAITEQVYSLDRLYFALSNGVALPAVVIVGGRLHENSLKTAKFTLTIIKPLPIHSSTGQRAQNGDWVTLQVRSSDLRLEKNEILVAAAEDLAVYVSPQSQKGEREPLFSGRVADLWSQFLWYTRTYFHKQNMLEVTTPSLVQNPGMEPELEPFATEWRSGSKACKLYLPTSPELHLKQLLAQGYTDIFEIKTVFRNEECTPLHEPEFQMLEWYRAFANLEIIIEDLKGFIRYLEPLFTHKVGEPKVYTVADLMLKYTDFHLTPQTSKQQLFTFATKLNLYPSNDLDWNDLFHLIWVSKVENQLPKEAFILRDYPPSQAALARINEKGWADRFEFYFCGVEIANAFHELNDPVEQRRRFEFDQKKRVEYGRTPLQIDENFMKALESGMPPSAGIAMGLDRLFMVFMNEMELQKTRPFGVEHQLR